MAASTNENDAPEMMTYAQAAEFTGIARATLYAYVSQKRVPCVRYGRRMVRFRKADLARWIERHLVEPEPAVATPTRVPGLGRRARSTRRRAR